MTNFESDYMNAIPDCCSLRTLDEHREIMLCWGLSSAVRDGRSMECGDCEMKILDCTDCEKNP
jgi:hypothetical protein